MRTLPVLLCLGALLSPASSAAQSPPDKATQAQAQALFDQALALMKARKYAEACPKLQQSQRLDPGMGTQFRLAECYEGAGLIGSAWQIYTEVVVAAKKAGRADRQAQARERADAIQKRVPMMTLVVPPAIAGLPGLVVVKRDGEVIDAAMWNRKAPVDPGAHTVVVSATGKQPWEQTVRALEGGALEVSVGPLQDAPAAAAPPVVTVPPVVAEPPRAAPEPAKPAVATARPPEPPRVPPEVVKPLDAPSPGRGQRIVAVVVGVVGLAGIGVGSGLGFAAKSQWNDALSHCKGGDATRCDAEGIKLGSDAKGSATISTVGFIAGGACVAAAVVLLATAPSAPRASALRVTPMIGRDGAFAALEGTF